MPTGDETAFSVVPHNLIRQLACSIKSCLQNQLDPGEQGVAQCTSVQQLVFRSRVTDTHAPEYLYRRALTPVAKTFVINQLALLLDTM